MSLPLFRTETHLCSPSIIAQRHYILRDFYFSISLYTACFLKVFVTAFSNGLRKEYGDKGISVQVRQ